MSLSSFKKRCFIFYLVVGILFSGCTFLNKDKKDKQEGNGKINIYTDVKDKHSLDILKFAIEAYKEENKKVDINISSALSREDIDKSVSKEKDIDLIYTDRSSMIQLSRKGLLSDMSNFYNKNEINDRFYSIIGTYGMVGDKYYGIGILPYTIEIIYNDKAIKALGIEDINSLKGLEDITKKIKDKGNKVPILLTEDIDPLLAISSMIASNVVNNMELEKAFDSGMDRYKNIKSMQQVFSYLNDMIKSGYINKDVFEKSNDSIIKKVESGEYPIGIIISYYNKDMFDKKINMVKEYGILGKKENVPIIVNGIFCMTSNSKNQETSSEFLKYLFSDDFQNKLFEKGFVTADKSSSEKLVSISKDIEEHISSSNINSILYFYNLPPKMRSNLEMEIDKVSKGSYDGKEWDRIVEDSYK